jgi:DNA-binding protein Fis|tara:strand:+ start:310 stop:612 length:303 start_codon:yes stop_codon:yes gene_type:complete
MTLARIEYYVPRQGLHDERILASTTISTELLNQLNGETVVAKLKPPVSKLIRRHLVKELLRLDWNQSQISRITGSAKTTIRRWIKKYGWKPEVLKHDPSA